MPGLDQTGPQGIGSFTGRGFGLCGRGFGRRMGVGRGLGRYFGGNFPPTKEEKINDLQTYLAALKEEIEDVRKQLTDVQNSA